MAGVVSVQAIFPKRTGIELAALFKDGATNPRVILQRLINLIAAIFAGGARTRLRIGVDDSIGVQATATITCTQATCTAGDKIWIDGIALTAVASGPDVTLGQYSIQTSDAAVATSIGAAINGYAPFRGRYTAGVGSNVVTVTRFEAGTPGNAVRIFKDLTNPAGLTLSGATFTGGRDPGDKQSLTAALSGVIANNETVTIGSVVLTGKSSAPSGESQFLCAVSAASDGAALVACINAHSKLRGLLLASGTSTPLLQLLEGGRYGALISVSKVCTNMTLSASSFAPTTTETFAAAPVEVAFGAL
jgi:hypothetical protein